MAVAVAAKATITAVTVTVELTFIEKAIGEQFIKQMEAER